MVPRKREELKVLWFRKGAFALKPGPREVFCATLHAELFTPAKEARRYDWWFSRPRSEQTG